MANITVGLIPSPDMPHKIINKIYTDLPNEIRHHTGGNDEWHIEKHIASIVPNLFIVFI